MNNLELLQKWYLSQCDGLWEHSYGVKIDTIDNPGWQLTIDLKGTSLKFKPFETIKVNYNHDNDWLICQIKDSKFKGACGPLLLNQLIDRFNEWSSES